MSIKKVVDERVIDQRLVLPEETAVTKDQLSFMLGRTPKKHIYSRPAKGGGTWDYVTGTYVKKVLNYVFAWDWDFEVVESLEKGDTVIVLGKLTVRSKGNAITKMQYGRADIKYRKGTKDYLDYGNDLKAATTDALKKCAAELGIASDIYGKMEFKEATGAESGLPDKYVAPENNTEPAKPNQIASITKLVEGMTDEQKAQIEEFNPTKLTVSEAADKMNELLTIKRGK